MRFESRAHALVRGLDHGRMTGIEIGPWYSPIAPRSAGWNTVVVDFSDGPDLRERARSHSAPSIQAAAGQIEDVDVVWRGQPLDQPLLELNPDGYDFLIASHVFEHIPDLIGLFGQLKNVIRVDGIISLAMPDRRYCFDYFNPLTMTDHLLAAHLSKRTRHPPETIFRANAYQSTISNSGAWLRDNRSAPQIISTVAEAYASYLNELAGNGAERPYVDAHAWIFVPANFQLVILELNALGLIDFRILSIEDGDGAEFYVQLGRGRVTADEGEIQAMRQKLLIEMVEQDASRLTAIVDRVAAQSREH